MPEETPAERSLSAEEIYQPILEEYRSAMEADPYDETVKFPNVNDAMMKYYHASYAYDGSDSMDFYYDYYDFDGNGTQELLIGYGSEEKNIVDVYGTKDNVPQKLIDDRSLGERSQLFLYPDGTMLLMGAGGAELYSITTYKLEADGVSLVDDQELYEGAFDLAGVLKEKTKGQQEVKAFDWKPVDTQGGAENSQRLKA